MVGVDDLEVTCGFAVPEDELARLGNELAAVEIAAIEPTGKVHQRPDRRILVLGHCGSAA